MRLSEVETNRTNRTNKRTNKHTTNTKTDFEQNVSKLNAKRRKLDTQKPIKAVKPS